MSQVEQAINEAAAAAPAPKVEVKVVESGFSWKNFTLGTGKVIGQSAITAAMVVGATAAYAKFINS